MKGKVFTALIALICGLTLVVSAGSVFAADPLVMKVSMWTPKHVIFAKAAQLILDEVAEASKGRIKMQYYYSGSLVPGKETLDGMKDGVAEIGGVNPAYMPGKLPLSTVSTLPGTSSSYFATAMAYSELTQMPEIKKELAHWGIRYLSFLQTSNYGIFSRKPLNRIADFKGMKFRTVGLQAQLLKALGGVPIGMVSTEIYTSLQRGTLDGSLANPTMGQDYRFQEPCPNYYRLPFGNNTSMIAITEDAWSKIPADLQKMFKDLLEKKAKEGADMYEGSGERRLKENQAAGKLKITLPTDEDVAFLRKTAENAIWKAWVAKMNKRGLPGQKVLDRWLELNAKWEKRM